MTESGTFAPAPGAAPYFRQVLAQSVMEFRLMIRNGEQILLAVVIPVIVLLAAVWGSEHLGVHLVSDDTPVNVITPGVLALAIMSTSFTSLAISTGFERRYGVIKRLGASPLPRSGFLLGKVGALLAVAVIQIAVISAVGFALGWEPHPGLAAAAASLALGTAAFAGLGLFIAGVMRAEATLGVANLIYLLLMAGGAVVLPAGVYGGWGEVARWLPSGALGEALRAALMEGRFTWLNLVVLAGWTALGAALTVRTFAWE